LNKLLLSIICIILVLFYITSCKDFKTLDSTDSTNDMVLDTSLIISNQEIQDRKIQDNKVKSL